jgi:hypothetical protein
MKTLAPLSAFALALFCACQSNPTIPKGQRIGQDIQAQPSVRFSIVDATPKNFFNKTVLVEAKVKAVCAKAGCWMQVEDEGRTAMVRWETGCGGQYKFPMEAVGKRVLIQGSFYPKSITEADAKHIEEEAGTKVAIPREGYEFNASSVLILDS